MRPGIDLLDESVGTGALVERHKYYRIGLKLWLKRGDPVRWAEPWGVFSRARLSDDGTTLTTDVRLDREQLINGLFYGCQGMRIGGIRKLRIAPHLAYRERGVPGIIPANALLIAEIAILGEGQPQ